MKPGDKVHYTAKHGAKENGIVKSISADKDRVFVVYKCNNDWNNYRDYTGCSTAQEDLTLGWVEDQKCDHHYIPTNAKYQPEHQRKCQFCGDIIN